MQYSAGYIIRFALAVCLVCALLVASAAVSLKPRQEANAVLDRQKKVLTVAGLIEEGQSVSSAPSLEGEERGVAARLASRRRTSRPRSSTSRPPCPTRSEACRPPGTRHRYAASPSTRWSSTSSRTASCRR